MCPNGAWSEELLACSTSPLTSCPRSTSQARSAATRYHASAEPLGLRPGAVVTTVGSHDTASAVVAVPATTGRFAYVSSGTWSLAGLELDAPVITPASRPPTSPTRAASMAGSGSCATSAASGCSRSPCGRGPTRARTTTWPRCWPSRDHAARWPDHRRRRRRVHPPGRMPARIAAAVARTGGPPPSAPAGTVRCILDSLATAYARTADAGRRSRRRRRRRPYRRRRFPEPTAVPAHRRPARLPVTSGPIEATALGNILVQARPTAPPRLRSRRSGPTSL